MLTSKTVSAAIDLAHEVAQLRAQNQKLIVELKNTDEALKREQTLVNLFAAALLDERDPDRSIPHVLDVLYATLAVIAVARCYVSDDPHSRLAQALEELDRAKEIKKKAEGETTK